MDSLLDEMEGWSKGGLLEKRAAALCEPRLLREEKQVQKVLKILDEITASISKEENRKSEEFQQADREC